MQAHVIQIVDPVIDSMGDFLTEEAVESFLTSTILAPAFMAILR